MPSVDLPGVMTLRQKPRMAVTTAGASEVVVDSRGVLIRVTTSSVELVVSIPELGTVPGVIPGVVLGVVVSALEATAVVDVDSLGEERSEFQ